MRPEEWLKTTALVKVTNKLDWTREDLINLAVQEFKVMDLTKTQLLGLINKLKEGCPKPTRTVELKQAVEAKNPSFKWVSNPMRFAERTEWVWSGKSPALQFANPRDLTDWTLELVMKDTTRGNWDQITKEWYNKTHIRNFSQDLWDVPMSDSCAEAVRKNQAATAKQLIPLPDNDTISRRYWSLAAGDTLTNPKGRWQVKNVRLTMDGPPVLQLEEIVELGSTTDRYSDSCEEEIDIGQA